jgi:hypothetical protein
MKRKQDIERFRRPELFLSDLVTASARGDLLDRSENARIFYRATVLAVDVFGGQLENPLGSGGVSHTVDGKSVSFKATVGPDNPKNSVKARIVNDGFDQFLSDELVRVFWPFFSEHDVMPVKPGEHVYVIFEDQDFQHGLWLTKVPGHENTNFFKGEDSYQTGDSSLASKFGDAPASSANLATDQVAGERLISTRLSKAFND